MTPNELIRKSAETGAVIATSNFHRAFVLQTMAHMMGLKIPKVTTKYFLENKLLKNNALLDYILDESAIKKAGGGL